MFYIYLFFFVIYICVGQVVVLGELGTNKLQGGAEVGAAVYVQALPGADDDE